jgi:photosystem II stability/assembly factor-like uncharacterized protein
VVSHDGGRTWVSYPNAVGGYHGTLTCPTVTRCISVPQEGGASFTNDGGHSWTALSAPLLSISCPTKSYCVAVGERSGDDPGPIGELLVSTDLGRTWHHLASIHRITTCDPSR